jgi:phosphate transport system substrate-binding protein
MLTTLYRSSSAHRCLIFGIAMHLLLTLAQVATPVRSWAADPPASPLVFAGCGSTVPITKLLVDAFTQARPDTRIDVWGVGSTNGVWLAAAGAIAVGLTAQPLREDEKDLGLTVVPFARTAVVIAVHPSVADEAISLQDLAAIYRGKLMRWGQGQEITLLTRNQGDSDISMLSRAVPGFNDAYAVSLRTGRASVVYSEQEMVRRLVRTPFAIGLSDLGKMTIERLPYRAMKVNGVAPTLENLVNGTYPLVKTLAFVFRQDKVPAEAKAFLAFVRSPEGEQILKAQSYIPAE